MCAGAIWQVGWSTSPHLSSCENQTPGKKEWAEEMGPHWIPNRFVYVFTLGWNRNLIDAGPRAGRMLDRKKHSLEGGSTRTKRATTFVFYRCWAAQLENIFRRAYELMVTTRNYIRICSLCLIEDLAPVSTDTVVFSFLSCYLVHLLPPAALLTLYRHLK